MKTIHRLLVKHGFGGGRFDDNGVDLDVLPELIAYKNILVETAKDLWRKNNPDSKRLRWHFQDSIVLKFYTVEKGSAVIPIERVLEVEDQATLWEEERDELDDATHLVAEAVDAAENDRALPKNFPAKILPMFEAYGATLREGEYFAYYLKGQKYQSHYTNKTRERLTYQAQVSYEDDIDVVGTVTMASIRKPKLGITLQDGREIESAFRPEDESIVLSALLEHNTAKLRVEGRGIFTGIGTLQKILNTTNITLLSSGELSFVESAKPIWQVFSEVIDKIPSGELNNLPKDGSINHDFYLYGLPKKSK